MRYLSILLLLLIAAGLTGCATTDKPKEQDQVSSIPWNRPASWEGQGAFGGMVQGSH